MLESTVAYIKNMTYIHTYTHTHTHTHIYIYIYIYIICVGVCVSLDLSKKRSKTIVAATRPSNVLGSLRRIRSEGFAFIIQPSLPLRMLSCNRWQGSARPASFRTKCGDDCLTVVWIHKSGLGIIGKWTTRKSSSSLLGRTSIKTDARNPLTYQHTAWFRSLQVRRRIQHHFVRRPK